MVIVIGCIIVVNFGQNFQFIKFYFELLNFDFHEMLYSTSHKDEVHLRSPSLKKGVRGDLGAGGDIISNPVASM